MALKVVKVTGRTTLLYGGTRPIKIGGQYEVEPGNYVLIATLTCEGAPLEGKTIYFYVSYDSINWAQIGSDVTDENGEARLQVYVDKDAWYKAEFPGDPEYDASSDTIYVTVTKPPAPAAMPTWGWIIIAVLVVLLLLMASESERRRPPP